MEFIAKAHAENPVCLLTTHNGTSMATRPMVLNFDPILGYYMGTRKGSRKLEQLAANGDVNVLVGKQGMTASCYCQILATCTASTDPWVRYQAWRDNFTQFGYTGVEDPNFVVLLLTIDTVQFVDMKTFKQETVQIAQPLILITGASGNNGKKVAEMLLASKQARVRVGVRDPAKVADLQAKGAEVVTLDWNTPATITTAFNKVDRIFLLAPIQLTWVGIFQAAVETAKREGTKFICEFSGLGANSSSPMFLSAEHGRCEDLVKGSGIPFTILQPTFFADNWPNFNGATVKKDSAVYGASGDGKTAFVATEDISAVATGVLLNPTTYAGQTLIITAAEALTAAECVDVISKVIAKPVKYVDLPAEAYGKALEGHGMPEKLAQGMMDLETVKKNGWATVVTDVVKRVTGKEPIPLSKYIADHKAAFL
ncbi:SDR family oxidoreductase [Pelomyxa schiedti]|nr:SDR family oxidoreductase [Pelomyxa schiedti]